MACDSTAWAARCSTHLLPSFARDGKTSDPNPDGVNEGRRVGAEVHRIDDEQRAARHVQTLVTHGGPFAFFPGDKSVGKEQQSRPGPAKQVDRQDDIHTPTTPPCCLAERFR